MAQNTSSQAQPVIDQADVDDWVRRFNEGLADHTVITGASSPDAQPWYTSFFGCFSPIDTCAITCCLPCITFGKTHHRTRKNANMEGYNCLNTSCLLFAGSACVALHWIPMLFQRADIRKKYNLQGDFVTDLFTTCCCGCCSLIQQDKEAELREKELSDKLNKTGYAKPNEMAYPA
ncbi:hypothetical protein B0A52_03384 [Exophiala mesophila]|uniref:Uncharacterized protein n=1 Tax=Exophiala mesophila TaxID=212818 RepID=A0A438N5I8_EXOME|nr:hypothetical protein B0A52_03384 [Exophiala mesophila]